MDKKVKSGLDSTQLISIILGVLGLIYGSIGLSLIQAPVTAEDWESGLVMGVLGGAFLLGSLILLFCAFWKRHKLQVVLQNGQYLWGEISDIVPNYTINRNGNCIFQIIVRYIDRNGIVHLFRSQNLKQYPDRSVVGKPVKVYYDNEAFKNYYVDLDGVLPNVILH